MSPKLRALTLVSFALVSFAAISCAWVLGVAAQAPPSPTPPSSISPNVAPPGGAVAAPVAGGQPGFYLGVASCQGSGCHASPRAQVGAAVLQNEVYTWLKEDPHQGAFNTLFSPHSQRIASHLDLGPAHKAALCLHCHSVNVAKEKKKGALALEDGVSCEGCHGPASGWRDAHTDPSWTHADSVANGLLDLRSASVRAKVCLGCHQGDSGRTVDHTLIAAGHPALAFELDNFSQEMTPHWKPEATPPAQGWAVGQVAAFREGVAQLARRAASERWPEFSDYSCVSCHHSLKAEQWKQAGVFNRRERPGLPPWSPARWAVLRQIVEAVAPGERVALDREVKELAKAVERMNRPREVSAAAERVSGLLAAVLPKVESARWDGARARALLATLAKDEEGWLATDVHSAEQGFWAMQTLAGFLVGADPRLAGGELPRRLDRLHQSLSDPEAFDRAQYATLMGEVARAVGGR